MNASANAASKMYTKKILKYFKNPKHAGRLKNPDGVGDTINETCGDAMKVFIKVKNDRISKIKIETLGCVAAIASSEALAELVEGKSLDAALKIKREEIIKKLGGEMPVEKVHCSVLAQEALKRAIENYKKKLVR